LIEQIPTLALLVLTCMQVPQRDVKLVILDSIAALLRTEFGGGEAAALAARGEVLGQQAAVLKSVAEANRIPVVVTNQVSSKQT
jgi:RecA/RadA recombinase